jgi:hypothetical protein
LTALPTTLEGITSLIVSGIGLRDFSILPKLPDSLRYLDCSNNPGLTSLPTILPKELRVLLCGNCRLHELPQLPVTLEYLDARNNQLLDIKELPPKLYLAPIGVTNVGTAEFSTNLLLTGNPLPAGFLNGYGPITKYGEGHVHRVISYKGDTVYTMILPKGTLLFRDSTKSYNKEEIRGIPRNWDDTPFMYPEFNVFFYPYPFVAENFINTKYIHVFELLRDVEVLMGVAPSKNTRYNRIEGKSKYLTSCIEIDTGNSDFSGQPYDPCFVRDFSQQYPTLNGMFVLASDDAKLHIRNQLGQRYWSKYRTNFIDDRTLHDRVVSEVGVPEIILHPHMNRYDFASPLNYQPILSVRRTKQAFDSAWEAVEMRLKTGEWTIDMFTKLYVNYASASPEVQSRCVPPEEPYKLHYLNYNYWEKTGEPVRRPIPIPIPKGVRTLAMAAPATPGPVPTAPTAAPTVPTAPTPIASELPPNLAVNAKKHSKCKGMGCVIAGGRQEARRTTYRKKRRISTRRHR